MATTKYIVNNATGQTINSGLTIGSLTTLGLGTLDIHQPDDTPWAIRLYNDSYSAETAAFGAFVWDDGRAAIGTETNTSLDIYTNSGYYAPIMTFSGSEATITGNLTVSGTTNGVKIYRALLTQTGTTAPTELVVFENSIGNIVWTRPTGVAGVYYANLAGAFTANKTFINCWLNYSLCTAVFANCALAIGATQEDECYFYTYSDLASNPSSVLVDLGGDGLFVEIRVYP